MNPGTVRTIADGGIPGKLKAAPAEETPAEGSSAPAVEVMLREDYAALLASSDVAVSTALNEFFGLAMIEAAYCGCLPLVPDRLAYPELYPPGMRYAGEDALVARLRSAVLDRPVPGQGREIAERFTVRRLAPEYAEMFGRVSAGASAR